MNDIHEHNLTRYKDPAVVDYYANLDGLYITELKLFDAYIKPGTSIVDIGVGGGRTTPWLSKRAKKYLGVDYSPSMVEVCRGKFPGLHFETMDATAMTAIESGSIDVAVFSFNGLDMIHPIENRTKCLLEINRILKPGGLFIFSEHNAGQLAIWPTLEGASAAQMVWRTFNAVLRTARLASRRLRGTVFRNGHGYDNNPVHGGLVVYCATPEHVRQELAAAQLMVIEVAGLNWPERSRQLITPWNYFVCRKQ